MGDKIRCESRVDARYRVEAIAGIILRDNNSEDDGDASRLAH